MDAGKRKIFQRLITAERGSPITRLQLRSRSPVAKGTMTHRIQEVQVKSEVPCLLLSCVLCKCGEEGRGVWFTPKSQWVTMGTNSLGPHVPPPVLLSYVMLKSSLDWMFSPCTFYEKDRLAERDKTAQSFPVIGTDKIKQPASAVLCS